MDWLPPHVLELTGFPGIDDSFPLFFIIPAILPVALTTIDAEKCFTE